MSFGKGPQRPGEPCNEGNKKSAAPSNKVFEWVNKKYSRGSLGLKMASVFLLSQMTIIIATLILFMLVSSSVMKKTIRSFLLSAVDSNTNKLEYVAESEYEEEKSHEEDIFIEYNRGYLKIDEDYLDVINEVEIAIYSEEGKMLYGRNPIAKAMEGGDVLQSRIYPYEYHGMDYYVYDRRINSIPGLWIRGVVPLTMERDQISDILRLMAVFFPMIALISVLISLLATYNWLRPIQRIEEAAVRISGGEDLKERIRTGKGDDELIRLSRAFNDMLDRLEASFESEKRFTSDASHELRTPMAVIMAQLELTLEEDRDIEEYKGALRMIERHGKRMNKLINDMLSYTRLNTRKEDYPMDEIDLSELVRSLCEDMKLIAVQGISLESEIEDGIFIKGNQILLVRLLQNLIDNAYKYGRQDGHIWVSLNKDDSAVYSAKDGLGSGKLQGKCVLSVRDDGIGIDQSEKEKIFERFYRSDASRSRGGDFRQGNGLGLSIVMKIAEMHRARLGVESGEAGSCFTVYFPEAW